MELFHNFSDSSLSNIVTSLPEEIQDGKTVGKNGKWLSLLDVLVHELRSAGKLRRKLVTPLDDLDVICRLLLQDANRQLTGDSEFTRSELNLLKSSVIRFRGCGEFSSNDTDDHTVGQAQKLYKEFLEKCNLVDIWGVCTEYKKLNISAPIKIIFLNPPNKTDLEIIKFFDIDASTQVLLKDEEKSEYGVKFSISELIEEVPEEDETETRDVFGINCPGVEAWVSFCRLLVNSRDELSVARLVTQSGLLTHAQCQVVRKETNKTKLTMLQNLVSYSTQSSLGGKSYAPGEEHPFVDFHVQIQDLVKLVESAQTKIESIKDPEEAVEKVSFSFKSWLCKRGMKTQCDILEIWSSVCSRLRDRQAGSVGTPGRGLLGKPVMNLLTGLVDLYSSITTLDNSEQENEAKTPARSKKLTRFFRTPGTVSRTPSTSQTEDKQDQEFDEFDVHVLKEGVAEKYKMKDASTCNSDTPVRPNYTRYKSSIAWAGESSPVPESADRDVRVYGCTLVSAGAASPATPVSMSATTVNTILEEINERQEQERKEETEAILKKINVPTKQKSRKRLLVKEAEDDMMKKYGVENKKTKPDNENTDGGVDKKKPKEKAPRQKKKIATPKGQRKMTSFFRA